MFDAPATELKAQIHEFRQASIQAQALKSECLLMIAIMCQTSKGKELARTELALLLEKKSSVKEEHLHPVLVKEARQLLETK